MTKKERDILIGNLWVGLCGANIVDPCPLCQSAAIIDTGFTYEECDACNGTGTNPNIAEFKYLLQ